MHSESSFLKFFIIFIFMYLLSAFMWVWACYVVHMKITWQLVALGFLVHYIEPWDWTKVISFKRKNIYLLNHLNNPLLFHFFKKTKRKTCSYFISFYYKTFDILLVLWEFYTCLDHIDSFPEIFPDPPLLLLPPNCVFPSPKPSPICAVHIVLDVWPSTIVCLISQDLYSYRHVTSSFPAAKHWK